MNTPILVDEYKVSAKMKRHDGMKSRYNFYKLKVLKKRMSITEEYGVTHFSVNPEHILQITKHLKEGLVSVPLKLIDKNR